MNHWQNLDKSSNGGAHYSVFRLASPYDGMAALRELFQEAKADDLNFCIFSTSGVHGHYCTIEQCEAGEVNDVTFLVVHPLMVTLRYGNVEPETPCVMPD